MRCSQRVRVPRDGVRAPAMRRSEGSTSRRVECGDPFGGARHGPRQATGSVGRFTVPGGAPAADFTIDSLTAGRSPDGLPVISASVRNTGGRALDLHGSLLLSDGPGGVSAGPFPTQLGRTIAVGDVLPVSIVLDDRLPAGPWTASVTLESGLTKRTAEATLTFPDSGEAAPVDAEVPTASRPWLWPALLVAGVMLVVITGVGIMTLVRRRRRTAHSWAAPTGAPGHVSLPCADERRHLAIGIRADRAECRQDPDRSMIRCCTRHGTGAAQFFDVDGRAMIPDSTVDDRKKARLPWSSTKEPHEQRHEV
jgi:hypothetical protein